MTSKSAIKILEIHSFASSACRIYPCKGATWAVTENQKNSFKGRFHDFDHSPAARGPGRGDHRDRSRSTADRGRLRGDPVGAGGSSGAGVPRSAHHAGTAYRLQ